MPTDLKPIDDLVDAIRNSSKTHPGQADEHSDILLIKIRKALPKQHKDQLKQLINSGPVWDGDVISKADRGDLIHWGLAARVMVKGQWGYTAATYLGGHVLSDRIDHLEVLVAAPGDGP